MTNMRAKMRLNSIEQYENSERLKFSAVSKSTAYPDDGNDEDNTYAKFSPSASLEILIANPALIGKFKVGEKYYVDFHKVEE